MKFTVILFLILGVSAGVFAKEETSKEIVIPVASDDELVAKVASTVLVATAKPAAPGGKSLKEEITVEEKAVGGKKETTIEIKKEGVAHPKLLVSTVVPVEEEHKEGIVSKIVHGVVSVAKNLTHKVKSLFGYGVEAPAASSTAQPATVPVAVLVAKKE